MGMDKKLFEIIACPLCKGPLDYCKKSSTLICKFDRLVYPIHDGVPVLLESEAVPYNDDHQT